MYTSALQLGARFSLPPNSLGYCGKNTAPEKFKACIIHGNCHGVTEEIEKFIVLYPYIKTIGEINKLSPFDYKVIESFWIGNDLSGKAKPSDFKLLLKNFLAQGVPDFFVDELKKKMPEKFIPHHLFQVLFVGVGRASGAVPFNMESINNCMIRWGKVTAIVGDVVTVNLHSLKKNGGYKLALKKTKARFITEMVPEMKIGDTVAVHWNMVTKILTADEEERLKYWTEKVIDIV